MAFVGPWEIALILIVVLFIFGPKKLPELAKSMGSAMKQYKQASEGFFDDISRPPESKDDRKILLETAKKLEIKTEGKTPEEISEEIINKGIRKRTKKGVKAAAKEE